MSPVDWDATIPIAVEYYGIRPDFNIAAAWANAGFEAK